MGSPVLTLVSRDEESERRQAPMRESDDFTPWVERAQRGDVAAYAVLHKRFVRAVHAIALSTAPFADVDDAVQEAFLGAWKNLATLSEPAKFPGWLMQIARRTAIDQRRRRRQTVELADDAATTDAPPRAEARQVLRMIGTLSDAYRETLVMRLVEGMSGPEIAAATGMTPESVRVNLSRGMKLLREKLDVVNDAGGAA
jgi:RNA polymerase sigma-70 factor (ECF subfamily)